MQKNVLITERIHESGVHDLEQYFNVRVAPDPSFDTLAREIRDADGVLVRTAPITRELLQEAQRLVVMARYGAGYDNVDVAAMTELGILLVNAPTANTISVAEHTLIVFGAVSKMIRPYDLAVRAHQFNTRNSFQARDLHDKTLGIIGFGKIGSLVGRKSHAAFDMPVIAYDPYIPDDNILRYGATRCDTLEELLKTADIVSLHVPLTTETTGMISRAQLALMKPSAILVNISRGGVVDEPALIDALQRQVIAGAALDVFAQEPPEQDNPLLQMENVLLTPHSGGLTLEAVIRVAHQAAQGITDTLFGRQPKFIVNPEVLQHPLCRFVRLKAEGKL
ncbi:hydroxyacid dehydrogenase [candidate division KSB3 bacterium]|uniref:Hydroxyacid dehydrogenase n=1 Tax=candidate division KSB3 bacterium TaxID=2044937 RepID=A0A9D5JW59_9BACT|nr:hydroxyacid dehydrogenase [candidate division KSB3 bacterium]MBD3325358.1 hydroxyacid dehydrogenase [candidate division KSB3 bacterium]